MLGPLLRAEERAIVQRMSNENIEVKFFTRYESTNAIFDVDLSPPQHTEARSAMSAPNRRTIRGARFKSDPDG